MEDLAVRAVLRAGKIQKQLAEYTKTAQGKGVKDFSGAVSNVWLSQTGIIKHYRTADAIKMRTNTYPIRVCLKNGIFKGQPEYAVSCRECGAKLETY